VNLKIVFIKIGLSNILGTLLLGSILKIYSWKMNLVSYEKWKISMKNWKI